MATIHILPDDLINKIAAGEVVERPVNVVKELVENAIDAGATEIAVDIEDGGRRRIAVIDNGSGMARESMTLALTRHATSKVSCEEDLFAIHTLGFRGEALPAIASVSRFEMVSREAHSETGHAIVLEGGKIQTERPQSRSIGTSIAVTDLFYNVPARLKFMKTASTEWSHIVDYITRAALSHPEITFELSHEGKSILSIRETGDGAGRLALILGHETARAGCFFEDLDGPIAIKGWLGFPSLTRKNPMGLYFFVNNRPIRDRTLQHAIAQAYQGLAMKDRYPVAVIRLSLPCEDVDVNVHPTKSEVRFRDSQAVHQRVSRSVRRVLQGEPWIERVESSVVVNPPSLPSSPAPNFTLTPPSNESAQTPHFDWNLHFFKKPSAPGPSLLQPELPFHAPEIPSPASPTRTAYADLTLIGQLNATYILCEAREKLILIDQHAAHERIGYHALKAAHEGKALVSEPLLIPLHFDLLPSDAAILEPHTTELEALGIEIARLGEATFAIQAVPVLLRDANWNELIADLIADLKAWGTATGLDSHLDDLFATFACHHQIRAHEHLEREEMLALLRQLGEIDFAYTCPHGRPAAVEVSIAEIEKWFKRRK